MPCGIFASPPPPPPFEGPGIDRYINTESITIILGVYQLGGGGVDWPDKIVTLVPSVKYSALFLRMSGYGTESKVTPFGSNPESSTECEMITVLLFCQSFMIRSHFFHYAVLITIFICCFSIVFRNTNLYVFNMCFSQEFINLANEMDPQDEIAFPGHALQHIRSTWKEMGSRCENVESSWKEKVIQLTSDLTAAQTRSSGEWKVKDSGEGINGGNIIFW